MLYQFMDFQATDFTAVYPDIKPGVGGVWFLRWDQWEPSQGVYNVKPIRDWLAAEAKNKLRDGSPKPLIMFLLVHTAPEGANAEGVDYSPAWVRAVCPSVTIDPNALSTAVRLLELRTPLRGVKALWQWIRARLGGARIMAAGKAVMPAYGDARWWQYLSAAVRALAAETDGQVQIFCEDIGIGCDGETWVMKAPWNAYVKSSVERMFGLEIVKLLDVYSATRTRTKLAIRATPGSGRKTFVAEAIKRGIGYHFCGMGPGGQNVHGWGNEYGTVDGLRDAKAAGLPSLAETTFGMGNEEAAYWSILAMLGVGVDAMDVHPEWLGKVKPELWNWAIQHMGKSAADAPSAWCVLRDYDTKYKPIQWTASNGVVSGQSDWQGDFQFYMTRTSPDADALRYEDVGPADAPESRQCRRVNSATFTVELAAEPPYTLKVRALDEPDKWLAVNGVTIPSDGTGTWVTVHVGRIRERQFTLAGNATAVHMLTVTPIEVEPVPPDPEPPEPEPPIDWAMLMGLLDEAQGMVDQAKLDLDDATTALAELRAKMREAQG